MTDFALDRYNAIANAAPVSKDIFNAYFIGGLSSRFDWSLNPADWDDALSLAAQLANKTAKDMSA